MPYLATYKDGRVLIRLYVQPRASRTRVVGLHNDTLKIAITAAPVDGKANGAVITFLSSLLHLKKKDCELRYGLQSRTKGVLVAGMRSDTIRNLIADLIR